MTNKLFNTPNLDLTNHQTSDIIHLMTYILDIRQRRQVTLPGELLAGLGIGQGDQLIVTLKGDQAVIQAKKQAALDALKQIETAFSESKVKEKALQGEIGKQRRERLRKISWI